MLAEGDIVPADATVIEAASMLVDESAVTGESLPVGKVAGRGAASENASVSAGTALVKGRGRAVVTATGKSSTTGQIAAMLSEGPNLTPLQRHLIGIGRLLAGVTVALCAIVLAGGLVRGLPGELMVVTAISLVVAAVPESLPAVVTLGLALGARRMAARHALIRRLPAVETLGSVTALATDKTGTLTEGRMVARLIWTPAGEAAVTGSGYAPVGAIRLGDEELHGPDPYGVTALLTAAALCNDARLAPPATADGEWAALGDPTEAALLAAAAKLDIARGDLQARFPRCAERPFDSDRKRMTTVHRLPDGGFRVVCKGAPEAMLNPAVLADDPDLLSRAADHADRLAQAAYRVLAVAQTERPKRPNPGEELEQGLRLLGLVAILDPPRTTAAATITACRRAGIRPILITGDHPGTARAIATELSVIHPADLVVDCRGLREVDLTSATVFARATPGQKLQIITALREHGEVVAMTGDGVNDGPALRRSDIGVAMGKRGTEVARQAADLVLADDHLGTVVAAVDEGRRVYANIRRFLIYGLSGGAAEIAVMLLGPLFGLALPLLPAQILWINLLTHGLPGVALGAAQLGVALGSRSRPGSWANPMLLAAVASALALQLAGLYLPPLRELLGTRPLTAADLAIALALSVLGYAAVRLDRRIHPGRPSPPAAEIPTPSPDGRTAPGSNPAGRARTGI